MNRSNPLTVIWDALVGQTIQTFKINEVKKTIQHFEKESGARPNRKKTCAMGLGEWNKRDSTSQSFTWLNQTEYLGGLVVKQMLRAMKDTRQKVKRKLKTAVNLWKARTLSLRGKALVINTCMVSRTAYTASVFPMPTKTLPDINKVIWPFLWVNSPDLLPREQATWPLSEGGVGIVDNYDKVRSIGMSAVELFRATAVEYDRPIKGETVPDRARRAKIRSWAQCCWNSQEWLGKTGIQERDEDRGIEDQPEARRQTLLP